MTCIVGMKDSNDVWIGGDSATANLHRTHVSAYSKVFQCADFLIGGTTSWRMLQLIQYQPEVPDMPRRMTQKTLHGWLVKHFIENLRTCLKEGGFAQKKEDVEWGGTFLMAAEGRLFEVGSDYQVAEYGEGYIACGSGMEYAFGAMHATESPGADPGARIRMALEAAAHHNPFVRLPFIIGVNRYDSKTAKNTIEWP